MLGLVTRKEVIEVCQLAESMVRFVHDRHDASSPERCEHCRKDLDFLASIYRRLGAEPLHPMEGT